MNQARKSLTKNSISLGLILLVLAQACSCLAETVKFIPYNKTGIYHAGEKVGWTVKVVDGPTTRPDRYAVSIRKNNLDVIQTGEIDLASGSATIETSLNEPGMIFCELTPLSFKPEPVPPTKYRAIAAGAAVDPTQLQPSVPCPADFDEFWKSKIAMLEAIPPNPVLTPGDSGDPNIDYATIHLDHINGTHVWGQIAKPKGDGKFPAMLVFQWASPPYPLQKNWAIDHAKRGWLTFNVEPHDVPPDKPRAWYKALPDSLKHYDTIGRDDRDKSYFLQMYLADYRAIDYITSRPDWDGKTVLVYGQSMGGQQSLCVAGLHPKVTHLIVEVPSGCDTNGLLHGRRSGYPNFPADNPKVMQTALYFDAVNFAPRIKARCLVAMGFVDTISPPAGVWTAFNQITSPKEVAPMIFAPHNNLATSEEQQPYSSRSSAWLNTLVKGGEVLNDRAEIPAERTDPNSRLAHRQLVEKAKAGGIDVYFLGDSITRRWGCTDPQYADFLANWRANFFGWNAANFGWGGDQIQNILWRIENGELDGVNPKVIVLLAGANNIGNAIPNDAKVADITAGLKKLIATCRQKAPDSAIILTGIFPRNDNPASFPAINAINQNLASFADGKQIRFININPKLADPDGKLFDGMTVDGLHPKLKAYQIWADALKPILTELLGPPGATDHAPPPTGDPGLAANFQH